MNELQVLEYNKIRVLTTQQLAEVYETSVDNIKNNHNRNKNRFIEGRDYYLLKGDELKEFKNLVTDSYLVDKRTPQLYLWTERGANRHSKILDTDKAWQQFDVLEETYFKVKNNEFPQIKTDPMSLLKLTYDALEQTNDRVAKVEVEVKDIKENQAITPGEYNYINKKVKNRIRCIKDIRELNLTREQNSKLFSALGRDLTAFTGVATRSQIRSKDFEKAVQFISNWEPSYTDLQIINQMSMAF